MNTLTSKERPRLPAITPVEVDRLIEWHAMAAQVSEQTDDFSGARWHREKLAEWRAYRGVALHSTAHETRVRCLNLLEMETCGYSRCNDPKCSACNPPAQKANSCIHIWSVKGPPRNPEPHQFCDNGCGLKWKDRQEAEAHAQKACEGPKHFGALDGVCDDCPPIGYPTNKTRCAACPRLALSEGDQR